MAVSPILVNGTIGISQDIAALKAHEQNKEQVFQVASVQQNEKETEVKLTRIRNADNTENHSGTMDSKEKGKNEYFGDGGRNRRKNSDGQVLIKGRSGFDISI
ncbi:MAG: hypothetical protein J6P05_04805 [Lachnospiraceae bacterium]|nr:hypothetical protein [Lachnospiraceae bacterium]